MILAALLVSQLVRVQVGDMPLLISAPHGGTLEIPDCPKRVGHGQKDFVTVRDTNTEELALAVAAEVECLTGKKPHYVIASYARTFVDANRAVDEGAESEAGKAVWNEYHDAIKSALTSMSHGGLIVDIHGQGKTPNTVYRGTRDAATLKIPTDAKSGPWDIFPRLAQAGWTVFPAGIRDKDHASFNGGYITATYGGKDYPTQAIQMEFGSDYRKTKAARDATAKVLAPILVDIVKGYEAASMTRVQLRRSDQSDR